eukprot:2887024-Pleurochrysis_carterae.AAC.2
MAHTGLYCGRARGAHTRARASPGTLVWHSVQTNTDRRGLERTGADWSGRTLGCTVVRRGKSAPTHARRPAHHEHTRRARRRKAHRASLNRCGRAREAHARACASPGTPAHVDEHTHGAHRAALWSRAGDSHPRVSVAWHTGTAQRAPARTHTAQPRMHTIGTRHVPTRGGSHARTQSARAHGDQRGAMERRGDVQTCSAGREQALTRSANI